MKLVIAKVRVTFEYEINRTYENDCNDAYIEIDINREATDKLSEKLHEPTSIEVLGINIQEE